ncbi:hypothetical protein CBL_20367 [Carabus blaptoides fortunei]
MLTRYLGKQLRLYHLRLTEQAESLAVASPVPFLERSTSPALEQIEDEHRIEVPNIPLVPPIAEQLPVAGPSFLGRSTSSTITVENVTPRHKKKASDRKEDARLEEAFKILKESAAKKEIPLDYYETNGGSFQATVPIIAFCEIEDATELRKDFKQLFSLQKTDKLLGDIITQLGPPGTDNNTIRGSKVAKNYQLRNGVILHVDHHRQRATIALPRELVESTPVPYDCIIRSCEICQIAKFPNKYLEGPHGRSWRQQSPNKLTDIEQCFNAVPHDITGVTPYQPVYGKPPTRRLSDLTDTLLSNSHPTRTRAATETGQIWDWRSGPVTNEPRFQRTREKDLFKFALLYDGPFEVTAIPYPNAYHLVHPTTKRVKGTFNIANLKRYSKEIPRPRPNTQEPIPPPTVDTARDGKDRRPRTPGRDIVIPVEAVFPVAPAPNAV